MMKIITTTVAVIGAGTAGLGAFRAARAHTDNVLLIEEGPHGTTCARVGCMPTKLLIAAAEAAHSAQHTEQFGVRVDGAIQVDGKAVMDRVKKERDRFVGFVLESVDEIPESQRIKGRAKFIDPHTLQVDEHTQIKAERIVIATGSSPSWPAHFNVAGDRLVVNDQVFDWHDLPESIAVFGPGVIGLEISQALHRLGVRVRLFGIGGALGPITDAKVKEKATAIFGDEFYIDTDANVKSIEREGDSVLITFVDKEGVQQQERFDYLLAATGRRPNVDKIGLENSGLMLNEKGLPAFNPYTLRAEESHIFIAGDVNNDRPLLHEAADEGRIAGDNAGRYPDIRAGKRRTPIGVVFSDPNIAMVGQTLAELEQDLGRCGCYEIGEVDFSNQGRSRVMGVNKGLLRVYGEHGSGKLLGAEMIGPRAEHLAHSLAWVIQQGLTVAEILELPFYHPVIEEGVRTALRDLNSKLNLGPEMVKHCLDCGPGA